MIDWVLKICVCINWRKKIVEPCLVITTYSTAVVCCVTLRCVVGCVVFCYTLLHCIVFSCIEVFCVVFVVCLLCCIVLYCIVVLHCVVCYRPLAHRGNAANLEDKTKEIFASVKNLIVLSSRLAAFPRMCWGFAVSYCITLDVELIYFLPAVGLSALLPEIIRD